MRQVPGVIDVINTDAATTGETQLVVDRSRLSDLGLTSTQVGTSLRTALSGTQVGNYAQPGQPDVPVIVQMNQATRGTVIPCCRSPWLTSIATGFALGQVVKLQDAQAPVRISRTNRELVVEHPAKRNRARGRRRQQRHRDGLEGEHGLPDGLHLPIQRRHAATAHGLCRVRRGAGNCRWC